MIPSDDEVKISFLESKPQVFTPRRHLGSNPNLSDEQRQLLDAIDVLEQKADVAMTFGFKAYNIAIIVGVFLLLTQGPAVLKFAQGFLGKEPLAMQSGPSSNGDK